MIKFKQHAPSFIDAHGFEKEYESVEDLLKDPWIQGWAESPDFHQFSQSRIYPDAPGIHLMAEFKQGIKWWVLGSIENEMDIGLPEWVPNE